MEELIYRRDCDLFAESLDWEAMVHDTMAEYGFTWLNSKGEQDDPNRIFEFARAILQKAQNVIDSAETVLKATEYYPDVSKDAHFTIFIEEKDDEQDY